MPPGRTEQQSASYDAPHRTARRIAPQQRSKMRYKVSSRVSSTTEPSEARWREGAKKSLPRGQSKGA